MEEFIKNCGIKKEEINEVILKGGNTLIHGIEEIVEKKFGAKKIKRDSDLDRKESVAIGASIQGAIKSNLSFVNHIKLLDVTNFSLGVNVEGDKMSKIIKRSSYFPTFENYIYKQYHIIKLWQV